MYFIELILKVFEKLTQRKDREPYNPLAKDDLAGGIIDDSTGTLTGETTDYESCEHVFMPIDSTNEILSCMNCGILVKRSELKNKNFFMQSHDEVMNNKIGED